MKFTVSTTPLTWNWISLQQTNKKIKIKPIQISQRTYSLNDLSKENRYETLKPRKRERAMATTRLIVTINVCVSTNPPPPSKPFKKRTEGWIMRSAEHWWTLVLDHLLWFLWWLISSGFGKKRSCGAWFNEEDKREEGQRSCRERRGRVAMDSQKKKKSKGS